MKYQKLHEYLNRAYGVNVTDTDARSIERIIAECNRKPKATKPNIDNLSLLGMQKSTVPKSEFEYYEIALAFHSLFKENLLAIHARTAHLSGATYKTWVTPIRLMIEQDKVTKDELREVWVFLKGHEFWTKNVQSTEKLRKQFNTLHAQAKSDEKRNSKATGNSPRTVSSQFIQGIYDELSAE